MLKSIIRATGAHLSRKGRSRHWLLIADAEQIAVIIDNVEASEQASWLWFSQLLRERKHLLTEQQLLALVKNNPTISVKKLIALTDCTLVQARKVLDELLWCDD